mgnify:CR=1 FL=1
MKKYVIIDLTDDAGRNFLMSEEKVAEYAKRFGCRISQCGTMTDAMVFNSEAEAEVELLKRRINDTTIIPIFKF